jgi:hypothetical protein
MPQRLEPKLDVLMATKLKAILDRAEAKDYCDIAGVGVSLSPTTKRKK